MVRRWISLIALAVGIFALITIEELPIGVLSVMAPDLGVSEGIAGLTVTIPGVLAGVVAVATPVIVVAACAPAGCSTAPMSTTTTSSRFGSPGRRATRPGDARDRPRATTRARPVAGMLWAPARRRSSRWWRWQVAAEIDAVTADLRRIARAQPDAGAYFPALYARETASIGAMVSSSPALAADPAHRDIPVIIMSALDEAALAKLTQGYRAFLQKPFLGPELLRILEQVLGEAAKGPPSRGTDP